MIPEGLAVTIFLCTIVAVFLFALSSLVRVVLRLTGVMAPERTFLDKSVSRLSLSLAGFGILCMLYGFFVEPYRIDLRNVEIRSNQVRQSIRIAHISDLHSDPQPRLENQLPIELASIKPDLIVYSGDSINSPEGLPVFRRFLSAISKIAPTYVVRGNWDAWYWNDLDLFGNTGAVELNAASRQIKVNGTDVWITGVPVMKEGRIPELLDSVPEKGLSLFLYHYPDEIEVTAKHGADIYFAGHTHGGQVALPVYGALMTLSKYGKRFEGGTYKVGNTWLNVNRGIGMEGGSAPRVRFWAPPEITIVDVIPVK